MNTNTAWALWFSAEWDEARMRVLRCFASDSEESEAGKVEDGPAETL